MLERTLCITLPRLYDAASKRRAAPTSKTRQALLGGCRHACSPPIVVPAQSTIISGHEIPENLALLCRKILWGPVDVITALAMPAGLPLLVKRLGEGEVGAGARAVESLWHIEVLPSRYDHIPMFPVSAQVGWIVMCLLALLHGCCR